MSYGVYIAECAKHKVEKISQADQKIILDWIQGKTDAISLLVTKNEEFEDSGDDVPVPHSDSREQSRSSVHESNRKRKHESVDTKYPISKSSSIPLSMNGDSKYHSSSNLELDLKDELESPVTRILANERYLQTRESILSTSKSFDAALKLYDRVQEDRKKSIDEGVLPDVPPTPSRTHVPEVIRSNHHHHIISKRTGADAVPIIIVPSAVTSLITIWNAKELLGAGVFVTSDKKKELDSRKPDKLIVKIASRLDKTKNVEYHIIEDSTLSKLEDKDWDRVVCVFATGANWQFKDFKRWHTPAEIFENVCGFHLFYDREELNPNIASWKVHTLKIGKEDSKRYNDGSVVKDFWQILGDWIAARNTTKQLAY